LVIEVPAVSAADLILPAPAEGSAEAAVRVAAARALQVERYRAIGLPHVGTNAAAPPNVIEDAVRLDDGAKKLVRDAAERMHLSARGFHRVLKLARTLADLDGSVDTGRIHLAEALSYRGTALTGAKAA
jgi:magnesium chelatase family protein